MNRFFRLPTRRRAIVLLIIVLLPILAWFLWEPGQTIRDGRNDRRHNGIWMQHAWLGDDGWFARNYKTTASHFRDPITLAETAALLRQHHITDLFPHLCPCTSAGQLPPVDDAQVERFLDALPPAEFRTLPWIGGVRGVDALPDDPVWRKTFIASILELLTRHPRLAGVHLNIEPMPSGAPGFLVLLEELRAGLPPGKLISVAAYPPPTVWHRFPDVHWDEAYFRQVAARCDQLAVMMYDTGLSNQKLYRNLMRGWTGEALAWSGNTPVLLGLPAYDDADTGYHHPDAENLDNAVAGIHAGLGEDPPPNYQGVAIYSEWEMTPEKWETFRKDFSSP